MVGKRWLLNTGVLAAMHNRALSQRWRLGTVCAASSWPRFDLLYSIISSYYCYYYYDDDDYNCTSLIHSLKMLHLFHFALLYWRIIFLWEILLIAWIQCLSCFVQVCTTVNDRHYFHLQAPINPLLISYHLLQTGHPHYLCRGGSWGSERLDGLPEVTQQQNKYSKPVMIVSSQVVDTGLRQFSLDGESGQLKTVLWTVVVLLGSPTGAEQPHKTPKMHPLGGCHLCVQWPPQKGSWFLLWNCLGWSPWLPSQAHLSYLQGTRLMQGLEPWKSHVLEGLCNLQRALSHIPHPELRWGRISTHKNMGPGCTDWGWCPVPPCTCCVSLGKPLYLF